MLALRSRLLRETFEAERGDAPGRPEWPPHPMRLYSALVSVVEPGGPADEVLRRLEAAPPPRVIASPDVLGTRRSAFVPTNSIEKPAHSTLPGRKNASRSWARVTPRTPLVVFVWDDLELADSERAMLARLCRRVPYLGRTTSPALVELADPGGIEDLGWTLSPSPTHPAGRFVAEEVMRVPFSGALEELRRIHESKHYRGEPGDPWEIGEWIEYGREQPLEEDRRVDSSPLERMVVLTIENHTLDGRLASRITTQLRRAIRDRASEDISAIHGHHEGGRPQVHFVALPFVGSERADGHILGLALILPRRLQASDARVVGAALPPPGEEMELNCGPIGRLRLRRIPPLDRSRLAWGLREARWRGPAKRWVTAYPIVFDRYLKRGADPADELRRTVQRSGYPAPAEVTVSRYPLIPGALDLAPRDTIRRPDDRGFKPYRHAILTFERALEGPVVIGSMRHYGLGLCVPAGEDREHASGDV